MIHGWRIPDPTNGQGLVQMDFLGSCKWQAKTTSSVKNKAAECHPLINLERFRKWETMATASKSVKLCVYICSRVACQRPPHIYIYINSIHYIYINTMYVHICCGMCVKTKYISPYDIYGPVEVIVFFKTFHMCWKHRAWSVGKSSHKQVGRHILTFQTGKGPAIWKTGQLPT